MFFIWLDDKISMADAQPHHNKDIYLDENVQQNSQPPNTSETISTFSESKLKEARFLSLTLLCFCFFVFLPISH